MTVHATRDLEYDEAGWNFEDDGEFIDPKDQSFEELAELLHEHCGENEVINREYCLYVSAEFPDGEWESAYLERYVTITVSDYVRAMEKRWAEIDKYLKQTAEQRDMYKERVELANQTISKLRKELEQLETQERYAIGENPND